MPYSAEQQIYPQARISSPSKKKTMRMRVQRTPNQYGSKHGHMSSSSVVSLSTIPGSGKGMWGTRTTLKHHLEKNLFPTFLYESGLYLSTGARGVDRRHRGGGGLRDERLCVSGGSSMQGIAPLLKRPDHRWSPPHVGQSCLACARSLLAHTPGVPGKAGRRSG